MLSAGGINGLRCRKWARKPLDVITERNLWMQVRGIHLRHAWTEAGDDAMDLRQEIAVLLVLQTHGMPMARLGLGTGIVRSAAAGYESEREKGQGEKMAGSDAKHPSLQVLRPT
jgi:hypothetical protein